LAWGLTLKLSHEGPQREFGKMLETEFLKILDHHENNQAQDEFMRNLLSAIGKAMRNMGFVRDGHVRYLDYLGRQLKEKEDNWKSLGDYRSLSKAGLPAKLIPLLGIGSSSVAGLNAVGVQIALNLLTSTTFGIIASSLVTFLFGRLREARIEEEREKIKEKGNRFWKEDFKPDMVRVLYSLHNDIKALFEKYYSKAKDETFDWNEETLTKFISNEVLPPDGITWPPFPFDTLGEGHVDPTPARSPKPKNKSTN